MGYDEMILERPVRFQRFPAEWALNWWIVCHFHTLRRFEGNGYSMHMPVAHPVARDPERFVIKRSRRFYGLAELCLLSREKLRFSWTILR